MYYYIRLKIITTIRTGHSNAKTEVSQFGDAPGAQEHVFGFDVSVDDVAVVLRTEEKTNIKSAIYNIVLVRDIEIKKSFFTRCLTANAI